VPNYVQQTWADGPGGGTPITAARLNHIEDGTAANDAALETLAATVAGKADSEELAAKADLDPVTNKILQSQIPDVSLTGQRVYVANTAARLALQAPAQIQGGDLAIEQDTGNQYLLASLPDGSPADPAVESSWVPMSSGAGVSSVNGQTGNVQLGAGDVGALPSTAPGNSVAPLDATTHLVPSSYLPTPPVASVAGKTGAVTLTAADVSAVASSAPGSTVAQLDTDTRVKPAQLRGVFVSGGTATTARPAVGAGQNVLWLQAVAPGNGVLNDLWYDQTANILKRHNGTAWVTGASTGSGTVKTVDGVAPDTAGNVALGLGKGYVATTVLDLNSPTVSADLAAILSSSSIPADAAFVDVPLA
jgi:hypothetical protein